MQKRPFNIWILKKCACGLNGVARSWYLTMENIDQTGATMPAHDEILVICHLDDSKQLHGIILTHTDEFWAGSKFFSSMIYMVSECFVAFHFIFEKNR